MVPRLRSLASAPVVVLTLALALFGWFTLSGIAHPGLQYDEALFVNGALGGHYANGSFVSARFHDVPTMLMPYIGALKSWVYAPVFDVFGVTMTTIRLPAVLLAAATIVMAFLLARRLFGPWPAALLALLLATDPAYVLMAKTDYGPIVLSAVLRVGALAAYVAWRESGSVRYAWLLAASVLLGVFNKVDYLAFAVGLAVAAVVVDHRAIVRRVRERPAALAAVAAVLLAGLLVEYREIYVPAREFPAYESPAGLWGRVQEVWRLFRDTMDGTGFFQYMTASPFELRTGVAAATVVTVLLAAALTLWRLVRAVRPREGDAPLASAADGTAFVLVMLLAVGAVLVATPQAVGPHHAMLLWPLPALVGVSLVHAASRLPHPRASTVATAVLVAGALFLVGTQLRVDRAYRAAFTSDRAWAPGWTTEIYPATKAVEERAPGVDAIVATDWGIANQLLALGDDAVRTRLDDAWGAFAGGSQEAVDQVAERLRGRRTIVVVHSPGAEIMAATTARTEAMIRGLDPRAGAEPLYRGRALTAYVVDDR